MRADLSAFFIFIFFILGASVSVVISSWSLFILAIVTAGIALFFGRKIGVTIIFAFILMGCFFAGSFYFNLREGVTKQSQALYSGDRATIISFPEARVNDQRFQAELLSSQKERVEIITRLYPSFQYGDIVRFAGSASISVAGKAQIFFPDIILESLGHGNKIQALLFDLRGTLVSNIKYTLPPSSAALAAGILFGDQSGFTPEAWELFRKTGTTHIVALSGYNIAVIANCVLLLSGFLSRRVGIIASIIAVVLFVVMAGGEASAVRAAIMGIIVVLGRGMGRKASMRNIIAIAALIMVCADPKVVVMDIGFELSFAAVMGIIYLPPLIRRLFKWEENKKFRDMCIDTASAEMAVMPIILLRFGGMSWYSFFTNIAIIFTVPLAMGLGFAVAIVGNYMGPFSTMLAILADIILQYELKTINLFAGIL